MAFSSHDDSIPPSSLVGDWEDDPFSDSGSEKPKSPPQELPADYEDTMSWDSWVNIDNGEMEDSLTSADDLEDFFLGDTTSNHNSDFSWDSMEEDEELEEEDTSEDEDEEEPEDDDDMM